MPIYHLITRDDWKTAQTAGIHAPASLHQFGFLHCCRREQIGFVIGRHFPDATDLLVIEIDPARAGCECRWEKSEPDQDSFPHLYGALPVGAVIAVHHQSDFAP